MLKSRIKTNIFGLSTRPHSSLQSNVVWAPLNRKKIIELTQLMTNNLGLALQRSVHFRK
jgi:hypothetical protein